MNDEYPKYYLIKHNYPSIRFSFIEFESKVGEDSYILISKVIFKDEFKEVTRKFYNKYKIKIGLGKRLHKKYPELFSKLVGMFENE